MSIRHVNRLGSKVRSMLYLYMEWSLGNSRMWHMTSDECLFVVACSTPSKQNIRYKS